MANQLPVDVDNISEYLESSSSSLRSDFPSTTEQVEYGIVHFEQDGGVGPTTGGIIGGMMEMHNHLNKSDLPYEDSEYIFDRTDVRAIFLTLYTIVFCSCFFGNLMVILVVTLHWRMRSITNFCLANLAVADLCVGIFCVYQNIITYLVDSWIFGEFLCKMNHFVMSLSTTASVLILVVICIERYLAIIHPMRCKQMMTLGRLRLTIVGVWVTSALISCPRLYYFRTISMPRWDNKEGMEILCVPDRTKFDSKMVDMISLILLFLLPLMIISILYFRIGLVLWRSSNTSMPSASASASVEESSSSSQHCDSIGPNNGRQSLHSGSPSPLSLTDAKGKKGKRSILDCCGKYWNRRASEKKRRRDSDTFFGRDRLNYHPAINLKPMNGTNGVPNGHCSYCNNGTRGPATTNGLVISCNGNMASACKTSTTTTSIIVANATNTQQQTCCNCASGLLMGGNGGELDSAPISPYLRRDTHPHLSSSSLSPPPSATNSINTEPIVLVKFEKGSLRKSKRGKCTILMRPTTNGLGKEVAQNNGSCCSAEDCESQSLAGGIVKISEGSLGGGESEGGSLHCHHTRNGSCHFDSSGERRGIFSNARAHHHTTLDPYSHTHSHLEDIGGCDKNPECGLHPQFRSKEPLLHTHNHSLPYGYHHHCGCGAVTTLSPHPQSHNHAHPHHHKVRGGSTSASAGKGPKRLRIIRSSKYGARALECRRRIIRMLIVIVVAFAACHLPFHMRKVWQHWGPGYLGGGLFSTLFTPITFLIMYAQSGLNPILYGFMSKKFRNSFSDLLCCNMRRSLKISRNLSVRSTNAIHLSQTT